MVDDSANTFIHLLSSRRALRLEVLPFVMADGNHYDHLFKVVIIRLVLSLALARPLLAC